MRNYSKFGTAALGPAFSLRREPEGTGGAGTERVVESLLSL